MKNICSSRGARAGASVGTRRIIVGWGLIFKILTMGLATWPEGWMVQEGETGQSRDSGGRRDQSGNLQEQDSSSSWGRATAVTPFPSWSPQIVCTTTYTSTSTAPSTMLPRWVRTRAGWWGGQGSFPSLRCIEPELGGPRQSRHEAL